MPISKESNILDNYATRSVDTKKIPHKVLSTLLWEKSYVEGFNQYFS